MKPNYRQIKLIALDLDGTLVGASLTIPQRNRTALQAAMQAGCWVTIATGRSFTPTSQYARELNLNAPMVLYQGALIQDHRDGRVIHRETLPLPVAREIATFAAAQRLVTQLHAEDGAAFTDFANPMRPRMQSITGVPATPVEDLATWLDHPPLKFLFIEEPARVDGLIQLIHARFDGRVEVVRSHANIVEITATNVSKGRGLAVLAAYLDVPREATLAMGDQDNDADMLAWAGIGVAIHDASPAARASADVTAPLQVPVATPEDTAKDPVSVARPHDEAVAWAVERYVLGIEL